MRKLFRLTALAALALPLMVACKNNDPEEDYIQEQMEELEDIINTTEEEQLEITRENITGIWEYAGYAWGTSATNLNTIVPKGDDDDDEYYTLHPNNSYESNRVRKEHYACLMDQCYPTDMKFLITSDGTWKLSDNKLQLSGEELNNYEIIHTLTKENLVISVSSPNPNGDGTEITSFNIYKRITEMPELPNSLDEYLMRYNWVLESDSVIYKHIILDEYNGVVSTDVIDTKVNQLKQNLIWQFTKSGEERVFTETDADGNILLNSTWLTTEFLSLSFNDGYSLTDFYKSLNIKGTVQTTTSDYLIGTFYLADDSKTLRYLHEVMYIESEKRLEYPIYVILTFKAK